MKAIRQNTPYCGVSMMYGSLRARGVKGYKGTGQNLLRSIDPIGSALRWPAGPTKRRPYSVAGPNSLWHIGNHIAIYMCNGIRGHQTSPILDVYM